MMSAPCSPAAITKRWPAALGGRGILLLTQQHQTEASAGTRPAQAAAEGLPVLINAWLDKTDFREGSLSM